MANLVAQMWQLIKERVEDGLILMLATLNGKFGVALTRARPELNPAPTQYFSSWQPNHAVLTGLISSGISI